MTARRMAARLDALERSVPAEERPWHRLIWEVGMSFDDMLDKYGRDRIRPGDNVLLREIVEPGPPDPVRQRDRPRFEAWREYIDGDD